MGRRRFLLAGAGTIAAAVVGGIALEASRRQPKAADSQVRPGAPVSATTTRPRAPEVTHVTPTPAAVQAKPIFDL